MIRLPVSEINLFRRRFLIGHVVLSLHPLQVWMVHTEEILEQRFGQYSLEGFSE